MYCFTTFYFERILSPLSVSKCIASPHSISERIVSPLSDCKCIASPLSISERIVSLLSVFFLLRLVLLLISLVLAQSSSHHVSVSLLMSDKPF